VEEDKGNKSGSKKEPLGLGYVIAVLAGAFVVGAIGEFYGRTHGWPVVKRNTTLGFYAGAMVGVLLGDWVYKIFNAGHKDFEE
jgi:hypothetical protein